MRGTKYFWIGRVPATYILALIALSVFSSVLLLGSVRLSYAQRIDNDPHATGLIFPTPEEEEIFRRTHPRVEAVLPNELALDRINEYRAAKGFPPLSGISIAPVGQEIISSIGSGAPDTSTVTGDAFLGELLPSVDNSTLPAFPPIRSQGSLGSCTTFATTYYQLTHMAGLLYGWDNKNEDNTTKFSPKWTYNMANGGVNEGSSFVANYGILEKHGAATWFEFPYYGENDPANYRPWCMYTQTWQNAIRYRTNAVTLVDVPAEDPTPGIQAIKQILNNGHIIVFGTRISTWQFTRIKNDKSTPDDDEFVRKYIAYWVKDGTSAHAMTIVGYNDAIWTDINKNRQVEPGEKGALRIANSWGTGWREDGFTWLAYDALGADSSVGGPGPEDGRIPVFWYHNAVFTIALKEYDYEPDMVAEFTVNHAQRDQLRIDLGISDTGSTIPTVTWEPGAINFQGGPYAFDGTTVARDGTFVFDFSDLLLGFPATKRCYLKVHDNTGDGVFASLDSFEVRDANGGETWDTYPPETIDGGEFELYIDHTPAAPDTISPAAATDLTAVSPTSSSVVLTWTAPGNDDNTGTASQYDIRYSSIGIIDTEEKWGAATQCVGEPSPSPAGADEIFAVGGLSPNTTYYFALKAADEVPNWSGLSNSASGTTEEAAPQTMHVSAIGMSLKEAGPNVNAIATVTIVDGLGTPVSGATVSGQWSGATNDTDSGTTDESGQVVLQSDKLRGPDPGTTYTFTIDDAPNGVTKAGWTYDETANFCYPDPPSGSITYTLAAPAFVKAHSTDLLNAYPSPGNPDIWIPFTLSDAKHVAIRIYDATGRLVRTLELGEKAPGAYITKAKAAYWDGRNEAGEQVGSGIYFYSIQAGDFTATKKVIIAR